MKGPKERSAKELLAELAKTCPAFKVEAARAYVRLCYIEEARKWLLLAGGGGAAGGVAAVLRAKGWL